MSGRGRAFVTLDVVEASQVASALKDDLANWDRCLERAGDAAQPEWRAARDRLATLHQRISIRLDKWQASVMRGAS
jgi:hypothetical protein